MAAPKEADLDLDGIYTFAIQLGKDAGAMLMQGARARMSGGSDGGGVEEKESAVDIVSEVDEGKPLLFSSLSEKEPYGGGDSLSPLESGQGVCASYSSNVRATV